jgi:hypothetical protein
MAAAGTRRKAAPAAQARKKPKSAVVAVAKGERRALIEDVAFFRASRFRDVAPGQCREEDRCEAATEIKAVLRKVRKRPS